MPKPIRWDKIIVKPKGPGSSIRETYMGDGRFERIPSLVFLNGDMFRTFVTKKTTDAGAILYTCDLCRNKYFAPILLRTKHLGHVIRGGSVINIKEKTPDGTHLCPRCNSRFWILSDGFPDDFFELSALLW